MRQKFKYTKTMTKEYYRDLYLEGRRWAKLVKKSRVRDGHKCRVCGKSGCVLNAHHRSYTYVHPENTNNLTRHFKEELADLTTLCRECHERHHDPGPRQLNKIVENHHREEEDTPMDTPIEKAEEEIAEIPESEQGNGAEKKNKRRPPTGWYKEYTESKLFRDDLGEICLEKFKGFGETESVFCQAIGFKTISALQTVFNGISSSKTIPEEKTVLSVTNRLFAEVVEGKVVYKTVPKIMADAATAKEPPQEADLPGVEPPVDESLTELTEEILLHLLPDLKQDILRLNTDIVTLKEAALQIGRNKTNIARISTWMDRFRQSVG